MIARSIVIFIGAILVSGNTPIYQNDETVYKSVDGSTVLMEDGIRSYLGTVNYPKITNFLATYGIDIVQIDKTCKRVSGLSLSSEILATFNCDSNEFRRKTVILGGRRRYIYDAICWSFRNGSCSLKKLRGRPARVISYMSLKNGQIVAIYVAGYSHRSKNNTLIISQGKPIFGDK